jgi:hypothetical protein
LCANLKLRLLKRALFLSLPKKKLLRKNLPPLRKRRNLRFRPPPLRPPPLM